MAKFSDIELFPRANYVVDVDWNYLETHIKHAIEDDGLDLNPDYQRPHVWSQQQQIAYVEYVIRGGEVGKNLIFNCPNWQHELVHKDKNKYELVDGKQRLEAARAFLRN